MTKQMNLLPQSIEYETEAYLFRCPTTGLYVGYDGYDTSFKRGISPCVRELELFSELNKKLICLSRTEVQKMLSDSTDKRWGQFGGPSVEIVRVDLMMSGQAFTASDLAHVITAEDEDAEDADGAGDEDTEEIAP